MTTYSNPLTMTHRLVDCMAIHDYSIQFQGTQITGSCVVEFIPDTPLDIKVEIDQIRDLTTDECIAVELYVSKEIMKYYTTDVAPPQPKTTPSIQSVQPLLN